MILATKSKVLLALVALFALLVGLDLRAVVAPPPALPVLPAVKVDEATKITIGDQIDVLTLQRASPGEPWRIVAPLDYPAEEEMVRDFVKELGRGIAMDARVDAGNLDSYGVDDQHAKRADIWTGGEEPALTVIVGKTAGPKSSFVRLPGDEAVYRADVGTRARFDRPAREWRERSILSVEREDIVSMTIQRSGESLEFMRGASPGPDADGNPQPGAFSLTNASFAVDADTVELLARALTRMRAGEIHNADYAAGFDEPSAVATLRMRDGTEHRVVLGAKADEKAAFVRVDDRAEVFRTSAQIRAQLLAPLDSFRDKSVGKLDRQAIESMSWSESGVTTTLEWNAEKIRWVVTQPANVDADQKAAATTSATLASLRAVGLAPDAEFTPSGAVARVKTRGGGSWELTLGQAIDRDGGAVRAKVSGKEGIFLLDPRQIAEIRAGFGRG
jgi:hypothetical protein